MCASYKFEAMCASFVFSLLFFSFVISANSNEQSVETSQSNSDFKQFLDDDFLRFPKCCPSKYSLVEMNDTVVCSTEEIKYKHFEIASLKPTSIGLEANFTESCGNIDCVDFYLNETEWHLARVQNCLVKTIYRQYSYFPKCCPADYAYDPTKHQCIRQKDNVFAFGGKLQALNISLSHCPRSDFAILDVEDDFIISRTRSAVLADGKIFKYGTYCIDANVVSGKNMLRACVKQENVCVRIPCLKKCCPDAEIYMKRKDKVSCSPQYDEGFRVHNSERLKLENETNYAIIVAESISRYISKPSHQFYIDAHGNYHIYKDNTWEMHDSHDAEYCIETMILGPKPAIQNYFLATRNDKIYQFGLIKFRTSGVLLGVSCFFLLLTIICYMILPEMQNVHGKSVLVLCIFLFTASLTLCLAQFLPPQQLEYHVCVTLGFLIIFTYLGSFAWLNIICFDMWIAFGSMRVLDLKNNTKNFKKFLYYNLYGWGVPIVITGATLIIFTTDMVSYSYMPHIGTTKCYFELRENTYDYLIYFLIPETIMVLINCIFFIRTTFYCWQVKNEIQRMRGGSVDLTAKEKRKQKYQCEKEKLIMLLKLFMVMGISLTFEVISSFVSFKESYAMRTVELILDCFNSGQGFIIFCIFILKKRVLASLKVRLGITKKRRSSEMSSSAVTQISTANGNANIKLYEQS